MRFLGTFLSPVNISKFPGISWCILGFWRRLWSSSALANLNCFPGCPDCAETASEAERERRTRCQTRVLELGGQGPLKLGGRWPLRPFHVHFVDCHPAPAYLSHQSTPYAGRHKTRLHIHLQTVTNCGCPEGKPQAVCRRKGEPRQRRRAQQITVRHTADSRTVLFRRGPRVSRCACTLWHIR